MNKDLELALEMGKNAGKKGDSGEKGIGEKREDEGGEEQEEANEEDNEHAESENEEQP